MLYKWSGENELNQAVSCEYPLISHPSGLPCPICKRKWAPGSGLTSPICPLLVNQSKNQQKVEANKISTQERMDQNLMSVVLPCSLDWGHEETGWVANRGYLVGKKRKA